MILTSAERKLLKQLGLRIREVREQKGWTLEESEEHGWPSWRHLQRIESGKNVTYLSLVRLARVFGMTISELLKGLD